MLAVFDGLREITLASVAIRLILAMLCGGAVGMERAFKRRPAGFRTHILICLGAAMTTLTSQYLYLNLHYYTDMARLGAQVIAGIGFIGAGTIIVTRHQRVKGLATAAGLWTSAIIGLSLGGGFYEGGILTTVLILMTELLLGGLENRLVNHAPEVNLYVQYTGPACLEQVLKLFRQLEVSVLDLQITRSAGTDTHDASSIFKLRLPRHCRADELLHSIAETDGVVSVQEM